jgi:hypothetical protein
MVVQVSVTGSYSSTVLKTVPLSAPPMANADPDEFHDLGDSPAHAAVRAGLHERLFTWLRTRRTRTTIADTTIAQRTAGTQRRGILIGVW